uniref:CHH2 preproprotein n=1 Tax=Chorismus antarcticus TaxID=442697 RepID=A0A1W5LU71_CHOAN|nr:CHH2 preproprotein [Chorismus antarcticus]
MWSTLLVVGLALGSSGLGLGRSAEGLARIEKLLASSSLASSSGMLTEEVDHNINKRVILDQSCKGIFDRNLFRKLDRVCEDCYNLYRKPHVGIDCRSNCYGNMIFRQCLDDLMMMDVVDEYIKKVQVVGK